MILICSETANTPWELLLLLLTDLQTKYFTEELHAKKTVSIETANTQWELQILLLTDFLTYRQRFYRGASCKKAVKIETANTQWELQILLVTDLLTYRQSVSLKNSMQKKD